MHYSQGSEPSICMERVPEFLQTILHVLDTLHNTGQVIENCQKKVAYPAKQSYVQASKTV